MDSECDSQPVPNQMEYVIDMLEQLHDQMHELSSIKATLARLEIGLPRCPKSQRIQMADKTRGFSVADFFASLVSGLLSYYHEA